MLHFIHRIDEENRGDILCCPIRYFPNLFKIPFIKHDIYNIDFNQINKDDIVILGGGGLFDCLPEWNNAINHLLDINHNTISWSCGFNNYHNCDLTDINFSKFKILTVRDYLNPNGLPFLPCVSCMLPDLQEVFVPSRKVGVLEHKDNNIPDFDYPRINNKATMREIFSFIGSSEVIITNTYHGCYWATLMGKKVVLYNKFSTKFNYLRYSPVQYSGDIEYDIDRANRYFNALSETRYETIFFANKLQKFIERNKI